MNIDRSREVCKFEDIPADCFSHISSYFDDPFMVENFLMLNRRMYHIMYSDAYMNFENVTFDLLQVIRMINYTLGLDEETKYDILENFERDESLVKKMKKIPFISKLFVRVTCEKSFCKYRPVLCHCLVNLRTIYIPDLFRSINYRRNAEEPVEITEIFDTIDSFSSREICLGLSSDVFRCIVDFQSDIIKYPNLALSKITTLGILNWRFGVVEVITDGMGESLVKRTRDVNFFKFFPNVVTIDAESTNLFSFECNSLEYCKNLENLRISDSRVRKSVFRSLPPTLRTLCLERLQNVKKDITSEDFSGLERLEELTLYMWDEIMNFQFLKSLKNLKFLDLSVNTSSSERRGSVIRQIKERRFDLLRFQEIDRKNNVMITLCSSSSCPGSDLRTIQVCEGRNKEDETTVICCSQLFCGRCEGGGDDQLENNICGTCKKNVVDLCRNCSKRECMYCVVCSKFTCGKCSLKCESSIHFENETFGCSFDPIQMLSQRIICNACQQKPTSCGCGMEEGCKKCSKKLKDCSYCGVTIGCYSTCIKCSRVICGGCKMFNSLRKKCLRCK